MDEFDATFVSDLVGRTCEAAVDPTHWGGFLDALERVYPESRITLFGHHNSRPTADFAAAVNCPPKALHDYASYYAGCSPYISGSRRLPVGRAFDYDTVIQDRELRQTEYYNDYLRPHRLGHYGTGLIIDRRTAVGWRRATVISLIHHRNDPDRLCRQARLLDLLSPHLRRAFHLHRTIAAERARAAATQAAFDHWAHAVVVFTASGRAISHNRAAEELFRRADRVWLGRGGRLCTVDDGKTRMLERAVRNCAELPDRALEPTADGIMLPSPTGAPPLRVAVWPLPAGASPAAQRAAVLMVIFDPSQAQRTSVDWLAKQFGLLPSEQRLTEAIVNGVPLAQAAEQLGIRQSTARTRLKTIQTKTNCRRQVDLVRLALSLSPLRPE